MSRQGDPETGRLRVSRHSFVPKYGRYAKSLLVGVWMTQFMFIDRNRAQKGRSSLVLSTSTK